MSEEASSNPGMADFQQQLASIHKILQPDELARLIDRSYLSINNLRAFLQILSIIITIFVAGAIYFGYVGVTNILRLNDEIERIAKSRENIDRVRQTIENDIKDLSDKIKGIENQLRDISGVFNKVALSHHKKLNLREQQLLLLLAREIAPADPKFLYHAAQLASLSGRNDEALEYLNEALKSDDLPPELRRMAPELRDTVTRNKDKPSKLRFKEPDRSKIYLDKLVTLSANILLALVDNGLLTSWQAQEIIDATEP